MINNQLFYCNHKDTYPPFKNGDYLEEYFLKYVLTNFNNNFKKKYIPALWTNIQCEPSFYYKKDELQNSLNEWIINNPSENGYFTIVQHDDSVMLSLPQDTIIFGACSGHLPIPLIYEDINNTLIKIPKKQFNDKKILCSFVGTLTTNKNVIPDVRKTLSIYFNNNENFKIINSTIWTPNVDKINQDVFINTTIDSKFILAPRGYGKSSFRFYEAFLLGSIPIYIWNDEEWLPFKDVINYDKLCISLHISKINNLENILLKIDEDEYNSMINYYNEVKYLFELNGMSNKILEIINK